MTECLISLGSNLGDRRRQLDAATDALASTDGIELIGRSTLSETEPAGGPSGQDAFLNACALVRTSLSAAQLFARLIEIEEALGRTRVVRWDSRSVDLDLLIYGDTIQHDPNLRLPHPRMAFRRFVLEPAVEVAAELLHPQVRWTMRELLDHLNGCQPYIAVVGDVSAQLLTAIEEATACEIVSHTPASRTSSPSLTQATWLESLEHQARLLQAVDWQRDRFVVSDFWLPAMLVEIDDLPASQHEKLNAAFDTIAHVSPQPMLVVLLEDAQRAMQESVNTKLRQIVTQPGRGPFLVLDASDQQAVVQEIDGAMQAMRAPGN